MGRHAFSQCPEEAFLWLVWMWDFPSCSHYLWQKTCRTSEQLTTAHLAGDRGALSAHLKSILLDTTSDRLWSGQELSVRPTNMTVVGSQKPHPNKQWVYKAHVCFYWQSCNGNISGQNKELAPERLPSSHVVPPYGSGQRQLKLLPLFSHLPLFLQGLEEHGSAGVRTEIC